MVSEDDDWEEVDGEDTVESWDAQMAAMQQWANKKDEPEPVAPAASSNDPDDVASALADVGAAMVALGRTVEVLAATLNVAGPPSPPSAASPPPPPAASQEQARTLLSPDELLATVPAAVATLLEGRMVKSSATAAPPPSPPPKAAASGFMGTAAESDEDASWFRQEVEDDEAGALSEWASAEGVTAPRALYPGEQSLDSSAWFDDDGDCLVDMPDWRETRARQLGKPAPLPPKVAAPRLSEGVAAAAAAAAAKMAVELAAKAAAKAAAAARPEAAGREEWDGSADESAYFDYDIDDDLPDWRESRK